MKKLLFSFLLLGAFIILSHPSFAQRSLKFQGFEIDNKPTVGSPIKPSTHPISSSPTPDFNGATPEECARVGGTFIGSICRLDDEIKINANLPPPTGRIYLNTHKIHQITVSAPVSWADAPVNVSISCPVATGFNYSTTLQQKGSGQSLGLIPLLFKNAQGQNDDCTMTLKNTATGQDYTIQVRLTDPFGVVYDADTNKPIDGAVVTLMEKTKNGDFLWPAEKYLNQLNPQITKNDGTFSFLTPAGTYYLVASKEEYRPFRSNDIIVKEEAIEYNIPLVSKSSNPLSPTNRSSTIWLIVLVCFGILFAFFILRRKKWSRKKR